MDSAIKSKADISFMEQMAAADARTKYAMISFDETSTKKQKKSIDANYLKQKSK